MAPTLIDRVLASHRLRGGLTGDDRPFDRSEKAWLLARDIAFKLFVDQHIHLRQLDGGYAETVRRWLE